jgi:hypothetical protein
VQRRENGFFCAQKERILVTALDLITDSLMLVGVVAEGESVPAAQAQHGLRTLNRLLDTWRLDSMLVYAIDRQVVQATANVGTYTIGTGATWNVERPVRIETAGLLDTTQTPTLEIPLKVLTDEEYQAISLKGLTSTYATWLYYDQAYPAGNVILWPTPTVARQVALYLWHPLTSIASLATTLSFPPGYENMCLYGLAVHLAAAYRVTLPETTAALAVSTMAAVQSQNSASPVMQLPGALYGSGSGGRWNYVNGEYR